MKKSLYLGSIILMMLLLITACSQKDDELMEPPVNEENTDQDTTSNEDGMNEDEMNEDETESEVEEENDENQDKIEGRFIGGVDGFSVEIEVAGEARIFAVTEAVSEILLEQEINSDDRILIQYEYNEELGRDLITDIEKQ